MSMPMPPPWTPGVLAHAAVLHVQATGSPCTQHSARSTPAPRLPISPSTTVYTVYSMWIEHSPDGRIDEATAFISPILSAPLLPSPPAPD
ncbi:hypothetical protein K505DRAFT_321958 [Melanomma pulvis-pyrius CBS 109.77]|uniref:Uncharacterized protein n=1 Tax=Melanomma pulvis-pyrius CBS 109.77 TaxID=1314802 RepID=A0A6A6XPQ0_9PLEO|nr:hypothetical protein K505DRAFT_321958 [Melanomma pulvis-pyrius CBS 109.77]